MAMKGGLPVKVVANSRIQERRDKTLSARATALLFEYVVRFVCLAPTPKNEKLDALSEGEIDEKVESSEGMLCRLRIQSCIIAFEAHAMVDDSLGEGLIVHFHFLRDGGPKFRRLRLTKKWDARVQTDCKLNRTWLHKEKEQKRKILTEREGFSCCSIFC